jgi:hypothetical protein
MPSTLTSLYIFSLVARQMLRELFPTILYRQAKILPPSANNLSPEYQPGVAGLSRGSGEPAN